MSFARIAAVLSLVCLSAPSASAPERSGECCARYPLDRTRPMQPEGLTICASSLGPSETVDRLAAAVADRGMAILARIDHAAAAAAVGLELRPTTVLIFGNPRAGTPLMKQAQTLSIDLPLKALVWEDEHGLTWLAYNDPTWIAQRHGAGNGAVFVAAMTDALAAVSRRATTKTTGDEP